MKNKLFKLLYKSILTAFFILSLSVAIYAKDNQEEKTNVKPSISGISRNVFIELFINTECTTCPKAAFCLEELSWSFEPGQVILVEEHIWGDGYDIPQTNNRYNWYVGDGEKGTPDAFFDGLSERIQGLCCDCGDIDENYTGYQNIIEQQLTKSSPVEISAEQSICNGKIIIQGKIANKSHSLLKNMIIGGMVYYEGDESELFYLVKDIFSEQDICQLAPMEEKSFSFISNLDLGDLSNDELNRFYTVIFVQDRLVKEIVQSFLIQ